MADFVNTQAIIARSLVMNLAYPQIYASLDDLFAPDSGVDIEFMSTTALGIEDGALKTWASIHQAVAVTFKHRCVAIGYFENNALNLAPAMGKTIAWNLEHRVIVINNSRSAHDRSGTRFVYSSTPL